ncbi:ABC transporter ATP-binding protein [Bremerella cremea]|uniref:ABC transporter ATP-binding protein n=1 Tax=Blastopirellula marina TaxID=124 RepID=A0A2S8FYX7_9BACT|nr:MULTISPECIES: ABC transporter ATP-binding protein [Pirellulaceae]PQO37386.1 ABC transporter ATP-binding protein [Blastopirellula marina]RCS49773.1 ABC transporter ATP-binding protein [Bremerella cremea]
MSIPALQTEKLTKRFDTEDVLRGIDLTIEPGQVVGLIGTNAAGKTTLIKCLLGLLRATTGSCSLLGEDSWNLSGATKARIGYVSQDFELLPWMTVQGMCDYTGAFYQMWHPQHVERLLGEWQLPRDKRVGALSVGQRQKLAVILAMGHQPELLMLDEPVASLDPFARRQFLQSLVQFTEAEQNTVLFSTHITSDLERIASHVAILRDGQLAWYGPLDTLKEGCKRLRIYRDKPLPPNFLVPGAIRYEMNGQRALVSVAHMNDDLRETIAQQWQADVQVEDLNLEEIFLEWTGSMDSPADEVLS